MNESRPAEACCAALALPLTECPRTDVAAFEHKQGRDLWCCACGRFWKGSNEELAQAELRAQEEEEPCA